MGPSASLETREESVTKASFSDKRWTIMAALLGTNSALMLFQGIQQEIHPSKLREVALIIIAVSLPFQAIYFMIHTYVLEYADNLKAHEHIVLQRLSIVCQMVAYASIIGIALLWYNLSKWIGLAFLLSITIALVMVRLAMAQAELLVAERLDDEV